MKYSEEQKYRAVQRKSVMQRVSLIREAKLRIGFPVKVEIENGFYIIESKMNEL